MPTFFDRVAMADLWALLYILSLSATFCLFLEFCAATITNAPRGCLPASQVNRLSLLLPNFPLDAIAMMPCTAFLNLKSPERAT